MVEIDAKRTRSTTVGEEPGKIGDDLDHQRGKRTG